MKLQLVVLLLPLVTAFETPRPIRTATTSLDMAQGQKKKPSKLNPMEKFLKGVTNNFQPFHGHGSLEDDLDDQWQAQQDLLRNRRSKHLDKAHLKQKYSNPESVRFDGKVGDSSKSSFGNNLTP